MKSIWINVGLLRGTVNSVAALGSTGLVFGHRRAFINQKVLRVILVLLIRRGRNYGGSKSFLKLTPYLWNAIVNPYNHT